VGWAFLPATGFPAGLGASTHRAADGGDGGTGFAVVARGGVRGCSEAGTNAGRKLETLPHSLVCPTN
jgi:hypothetical protein